MSASHPRKLMDHNGRGGEKNIKEVQKNSVFQAGHGHCILELLAAMIICLRAVQSVLNSAVVALYLGHSQQPPNWT